MTWKKLDPIKSTRVGCLNCGGMHSVAPMEMKIAVGFGGASVTRDKDHVYDEPHIDDRDAKVWTVADAEAAAADDPDHDWRIEIHAPLHEETYQRQDGEWRLVAQGQGFA